MTLTALRTAAVVALEIRGIAASINKGSGSRLVHALSSAYARLGQQACTEQFDACSSIHLALEVLRLSSCKPRMGCIRGSHPSQKARRMGHPRKDGRPSVVLM